VVDEKRARRYELRKRADTMAETRQRITEAAVALHGSIGPARTTVAAIAERAGVQRHTVYRHFPTEADVFAACTQHYSALHPWPDPAAWDGDTNTALNELYAYYAEVEPMMTNALRDAEVTPIVAAAMQPYLDYLEKVTGLLTDGSALTTAAIRHAVDFRTWRSLVRQNELPPSDAVRLMTRMIG
jgi:AcrR family transcriptional regulator